MHHHFIDQYSHGKSFYHRLPAAVKISAMISFVVVIATTPAGSFFTFAIYAAMLLFLAFIASVPFSFVARRLLILVPFIALVGVFSVGKILFFSLFCKAILCATAMLLLVATTRFETLLKGFERLKLPRLIVMTISFMYRYTFILSGQIMAAVRAKESRAPRMKRWPTAKVFSNILGSLFLKTYERGEEVYLAMCARGFDGHIHTTVPERLTSKDILTGIALFLLPVAVRIFGTINGN